MLLFAVLERTLKYLHADTKTMYPWIEDAFEWVMCLGPYSSRLYNTYLFSASMICFYLDINHEILKTKTLRLVESRGIYDPNRKRLIPESKREYVKDHLTR